MHRVVAALSGVLLLAACQSQQKRGSSFQLPEPSKHVTAKEAELAPLIEKSQRGGNGPGQCTVRLLEEKDDTDDVWANCRWLPSGTVGGPFSIKGEEVIAAKQGSDYEASVRQLFPYELAEAILYDAERLQPEDEPTG